MSVLPQNWKNDRIKDVALVNGNSLPAHTDPDYEFDYLEISNVDYYGVIDPRAIERVRYEDAPSRARRGVQRGSTVISSVRPNLQAAAFIDSGLSSLVCSTGFNVVQPLESKLRPKFAYYTLISEAARQHFEATAKGVGYPAVDDKDFKSLNIPLPPLSEQERIAAYLDVSCAAIDAAVAAKRRQTETLDVLYKSTIHRAVTFGLDSSVKTKTAGLLWLDKVPAHWAPRRIRDLATLSPGYSDSAPASDELCSVVPMELLSTSGTIETDQLQSFGDIAGGLTLFESGDVLFAKITPCMENGKGAHVDSLPTRYAFGSTEFHVLRPHNALNGRFLYFYTFNPIFRAYAAENMSGAAGQKRVSSRFLKDTRLFLPPISEQREIVTFLDDRRSHCRELTTVLERQIGTLLSYRNSLIYECITGQRRVTKADIKRVQAYG